MAMTGGRNDDTDSRVSGRERGGEIPMRLKLTAAGWIPDRGERERLCRCLRGTGKISQKRKRFLYEQIVRSGGNGIRSRRGDYSIEHLFKSFAWIFYGITVAVIHQKIRK